MVSLQSRSFAPRLQKLTNRKLERYWLTPVALIISSTIHCYFKSSINLSQKRHSLRLACLGYTRPERSAYPGTATSESKLIICLIFQQTYVQYTCSLRTLTLALQEMTEKTKIRASMLSLRNKLGTTFKPFLLVMASIIFFASKSKQQLLNSTFMLTIPNNNFQCSFCDQSEIVRNDSTKSSKGLESEILDWHQRSGHLHGYCIT